MRETRFQSRTVSAAGQTDHQRDGTVREAKRGPFGVLVSGHVSSKLVTFVATKFCLSLEIFVARVCRDKNYT